MRFELVCLFILLFPSLSAAGSKCEAHLRQPSTPQTILEAGPMATVLDQISAEDVALDYAGVFYRSEVTPPHKIESFRGVLTDAEGVHHAFRFDFDGLHLAASSNPVFGDYHGGWAEFSTTLSPFVKGQRIPLKYLGAAYPNLFEPLTRQLVFSGLVITETGGATRSLFIKIDQRDDTPERIGKPNWIMSGHAHLTLHE